MSVSGNLYRLEQLIGTDKIERLAATAVLIIGIGGVGGYAVEALARSGIGKLVIVDYDVIDESNLNRQIIALHSTVGRDKVAVFRERIHDINPNVVVEAKKMFIEENNLAELLDNIDYVIDACDSLNTKLAIIKYCKDRNISFVSCMGTGNKMDPTRLKIMDIRKTSYDPLAKRVRKFVMDEKINGRVMVVCSDEEKYSSNTKPIPSNAFVPAVAGMLCSSYIINEIVK